MTMTTTSEKPQRRKIKLINREFQVGLMVKFILANAAILALFGAVLFLFLRGEVESNLHSAHVTYRTVGGMLFPIILTVSLLILAILSVTIIFVILNASHRIAGPMYRFNQALNEMGGRNLRAMTSIREDDQLAEISASLARVRDVWGGDVARLRSLAAEAQGALAAGAGEVVEQKLAEIKTLLDGYGV
jgi:hypothetical protein